MRPSHSMIAGVLLAAIGDLAGAQQPVWDWGAAMDVARADARLSPARERLLATARETAATPIIRRVYRPEDLGKFRSTLGERTVVQDGHPRQAMFALAKSDNVAAKTIAEELPLLAVAYRWTMQETFKTRVIAQLEEVTTWSPLQRPGWSLRQASPEPVSSDFRDGCWLATGWGIRAVADTLELMPAGSLPQTLVDTLHELLAREIAGIVDDWKTKPSWFIRQNNPRTNQWSVPTEGLVRGCVVLGKEKFPSGYALGVRNLLASLDAQGTQGECHEGIMYAALSVESLLHAARAMAVVGDRRAADHPFFRRFPVWLAHHFQPGRSWINCFDVRLQSDGRCRQLLSLLLVLTNDPVARWTLSTQFAGPLDDVAGMAARSTHGESRPPALFAAYESATRVNWRSSWVHDATGVWVRGGHPLDGHDHYDRGHVNFILRGRPILIEAGTPRDYGDPQIGPLYQSLVGHNVLEVEGITAQKKPAAITVPRLDTTGGEVLVDPTPGYSGLRRWKRRVAWTIDRLEVTDEVLFPEGQARNALFRWHLGTAEDVKRQIEGSRVTLSWDEVTMSLESSIPLSATAELLPDNTINLDAESGGKHLHRCLIVSPERPGTSWTLKTVVVGMRG